MSNPEEIMITHEHWRQMRAHVSRQDPIEACGLIGGKHNRSLEIFPTSNILHSPIRFQIDPREQLRTFNLLDQRGWDLLAIYHSHPKGPPGPSSTDISEASYPHAFNLIWFQLDSIWQCKAFTISAGSFKEAKLNVTAAQ